MRGSVPFEEIPADVVQLCRRLAQAGYEARLVGGCVRDILLARRIKDWDVATSAHPAQVQRLFPRHVPLGIEHGTIMVLLDERQVEVTTYRGETTYSDGRHPDSVVFVSSIEEDLQRRDLTINAIAYDPLEQRLIDPYGGSDDLRRGVIRAVGDPRARFTEDGLRPLRAIRLAAVLGFVVERHTLEAISRTIDTFRRVSWERIRDELLKLLEAPRPSAGVELMRQTGLLAEVLPELLAGMQLPDYRQHGEEVYRHVLAVCDESRGDAVLRLAALLHDVGKAVTAQPAPDRPGALAFPNHARAGAELVAQIARRLRLSNAQSARLTHLVAHHSFTLEEGTPAGLRRWIREVGVEDMDDLFELRRADLQVRTAEAQGALQLLAALRQRVERVLRERPPMSIAELAIDGEQIKARLGVPPGPHVGQLLRALLERVLEEPSLNSPAQLLELVDELAQAGETGPG